jgi:chromate reductase, NAD(P)H dehydrogenase (quinone)
MSTLDIVAICGSLRQASLNRAALRLAAEVMPASMTLEVLTWADVPVYDADGFAPEMPAPVLRLRERVRRADGVLVATPEYNFSIPGGLKNLIDCTSRGSDQPWALKPVAILSASPGALGGGRVQYDLRKVMLFLEAMVMVKPEVFIGGAAAKFDAAGRCTDEATRQHVATQMAAFERWIAGVARFTGG